MVVGDSQRPIVGFLPNVSIALFSPSLVAIFYDHDLIVEDALTLDAGKRGAFDRTDPTRGVRHCRVDLRPLQPRPRPKRRAQPRPAERQRKQKACEAAGRLFLVRILEERKKWCQLKQVRATRAGNSIASIMFANIDQVDIGQTNVDADPCLTVNIGRRY